MPIAGTGRQDAWEGAGDALTLTCGTGSPKTFSHHGSIPVILPTSLLGKQPQGPSSSLLRRVSPGHSTRRQKWDPMVLLWASPGFRGRSAEERTQEHL